MLPCLYVGPMQGSSRALRFPLRAAAVTGARVARAFTHALDDDEQSAVAELRAATVAFAATAKAEGRSPDEALIALKRAIERAGWWPSLVPPRRAGWDEQPPEFLLYRTVFGWFLEGYFGARQ